MRHPENMTSGTHYEIRYRRSGSVLFACELPADVAALSPAERMGWAVKEALKSGADLRDADLRGAFLPGADLRGANLSSADLSGAFLPGADLRGAFLCGAYFRGANLQGANLSGAYLRDADLSYSFLRSANLSGADLSGDSFNAWPTPTAPGRTRRDYGAPVRVWRAGTWYTAMPPRSERAAAQWRHDDGTWECVCVPHDGGHGRTDAYAPGPHLGVRVAWGDIPPAVQAQLRASFLADYCPKGAP